MRISGRSEYMYPERSCGFQGLSDVHRKLQAWCVASLFMHLAEYLVLVRIHI